MTHFFRVTNLQLISRSPFFIIFFFYFLALGPELWYHVSLIIKVDAKGGACQMALCIKHCIKAKQGISITLMRRPIYHVFTLLLTLLTFTQTGWQMVHNNVRIRQLRQHECGRVAFNYGQTKLFYVWTRAAEVVHPVSADWWISRPIGERLSLISINPTGGKKTKKNDSGGCWFPGVQTDDLADLSPGKQLRAGVLEYQRA